MWHFLNLVFFLGQDRKHREILTLLSKICFFHHCFQPWNKISNDPEIDIFCIWLGFIHDQCLHRIHTHRVLYIYIKNSVSYQTYLETNICEFFSENITNCSHDSFFKNNNFLSRLQLWKQWMFFPMFLESLSIPTMNTR